MVDCIFLITQEKFLNDLETKSSPMLVLLSSKFGRSSKQLSLDSGNYLFSGISHVGQQSLNNFSWNGCENLSQLVCAWRGLALAKAQTQKGVGMYQLTTVPDTKFQ